MKRPVLAVAAAVLSVSACDLALPTSADEARDHLGRDRVERIIPIQLPLPEISVTLSEQLGELSDIVDTTDLSFRVEPDTFAFALDSLLALDPIDPAPVTQGYDLAVADFTRTVAVTVPAVPIDPPSPAGRSIPLPPTASSDSVLVPFELTGFAHATFGAGELQVNLETDASATLTGVSAAIRDAAGATLATSSGSVDVPSGSTGTIPVPLAGVTLPSDVGVVLRFDGATADLDLADDDLTVSIRFVGAEVTAAEGVDASTLSPVTFSERVPLDFGGTDFSQATLETGTVAVAGSDFGGLVFTPDFDGSLAGLRIGADPPDELVVAGTVGPAAEATTVDVSTSATVTVAFTDLRVASVTLNRVEMDVDRTVAVTGDSVLDGLSGLTIESGLLEVRIANRLGVGGVVRLELGGVTRSGTVVTESFYLEPSHDGSPVTTTATVDLAGVVLDPAMLAPRVTGTLAGSDVTVTRAAAAEAVTVDPWLEVRPREMVLAGIPDLDLILEERVTIATADIDLGGLADVVDRIQFNDVSFTVSVQNGTGLDLRVDDFWMTLLDAAGDPVTDGAGDTARVELSSAVSGPVVAAARATTEVQGDGARFVNALLDRIAAGEDVEVVAEGRAGPAADTGRIALGDSVEVVFEMRLGPDLSIDPAGITVDEVVHEAIELDSIAAELMADLSEDLVSASVEFEAVNGMPLGLALAMAIVPTPTDTVGFDPFAPGVERIELPRFQIDPAQVDADGRATAATVSSPEAAVDPARFDLLAEKVLSVGLRAEVLGPVGGRARLQPTDSLVLRPLLKLEVRVSGNGGTP